MLENTPTEYRDKIREKLDMLPDQPGVYLHKNIRGEIIYVGKAISLKNRVRQYFQSLKNQAPKVLAMVRNVTDFEYILTESEAEALTLESNLIKQYRPRYNILLKDDKSFPYVRINMNTPFPRVEIVYAIRKDNARYFGPFLSKHAVKEAIESIRENFPLRTCKKDLIKAAARGERPCLNYYINRCVAPCTGKVSKEEYRALVEEVINFLNGDTEEVIEHLTEEMHEASEELAFEKAGMIKERIRAIELIGEKQRAIAANIQERDIFAFAENEGDTLVYALLMRNGKIIGAQNFNLLAQGENVADAMNSFLKQFYGAGSAIPKEIIVRDLPSDLEAIEYWLSELRGSKVTITVPQRGDKRKLVSMAYKNACDQLQKQAATKRREWERGEGALHDLSLALELHELPRRIEAFDISHTAGTDPVASMVVFVDGKPANKLYRRFRIRTATNDDYASMKEVITRRFSRGIKEREEGKRDGFAVFPDLLLIDGGKGQLGVALDALHELGIFEGEEIFVFGLAERMEEIFLPERDEPILLETASPALHLLQRVRNEAHRFAISYHRSLRQKTSLYSLLDDIPGIGPKRKRLLFDQFSYIDAIKKASEEELSAIKGMDKNSAKAVYDFFHQEQEKAQE